MSTLSTRCKYFVLLGLVLFTFGEATPYQNLFKPCVETPRSSIEGIDGTYIINLDARPEKWHRLQPLLHYWGIDYCRFSAVYGVDFDVPTLKVYAKKHLRPGGMGCMLSHLSIYQDALDRGLKTIWVMEDDADVRRDPRLLTQMIEELDQVDPNWDILYTDLDWTKSDGEPVRSLAFPIDKAKPFSHSLDYYTHRENVSKNIQLIRARYGTCSMIVSERGMKKILHHFTTYEDILWPIDVEVHYVPGIREYGLRNPIVTNGHFPFNHSDAGRSIVAEYYEIDDAHVAELEAKHECLREICRNWLGFLGLKKTNL